MRKSLGSILIESKKITIENLSHALEVQKTTQEKLGETLIKLNYCSEEDIYDALAVQGKARINILTRNDIDTNLIKLFDISYLRNNYAIPLIGEDSELKIIINNFHDYKITDFIINTVKSADVYFKNSNTYLGTKNEILTFYDTNFIESSITVAAEEEELIEEDDNIDASSSPIVQFVEDILNRAIRERSSDVHIEPHYNSETTIRNRIDGELVAKGSCPRSWHKKVISRLKIMSKLNTAKTFEPQDGNITYKYLSSSINMRLSIMPTINGEKAVIRIMTGNATLLDMSNLGMSAEGINIFRRNLDKRRGMILITAPTGAGKTTTLYSGLKYLNKSNVNITTIEDPVEIRLAGTNQIQVSQDITFAKALRSILRQDPDIIMVGEIRDDETADIATKAATTGHLMLSTLHTKDIHGIIARLLKMGIPGYLIADSLTLVITQRLIKKLCDNCKVIDNEDLETIRSLNPKLNINGPIYKVNKEGCNHCTNGFKGRIGLYEFLEINENIEDIIADEDITKLRDIGLTSRTLFEEGLDKVINGNIDFTDLLQTLGLNLDVLKTNKIKNLSEDNNAV